MLLKHSFRYLSSLFLGNIGFIKLFFFFFLNELFFTHDFLKNSLVISEVLWPFKISLCLGLPSSFLLPIEGFWKHLICQSGLSLTDLLQNKTDLNTLPYAMEIIVLFY